jgi:hypothetical protein
LLARENPQRFLVAAQCPRIVADDHSIRVPERQSNGRRRFNQRCHRGIGIGFEVSCLPIPGIILVPEAGFEQANASDAFKIGQQQALPHARLRARLAGTSESLVPRGHEWEFCNRKAPV